MLYSSSYCEIHGQLPSSIEDFQAAVEVAYLFQCRNHNIRPVVDRKHDIRNPCSSQALDLMQDHRPVRKLDQWFRKSEGLHIVVLSLDNQEKQTVMTETGGSGRGRLLCD